MLFIAWTVVTVNTVIGVIAIAWARVGKRGVRRLIAAGVLAFSAACEDPFFSLYDGGVLDAAIDAGPSENPSCAQFSIAYLPYGGKGGAWSAVQTDGRALFATNTMPLEFFSAGLNGAAIVSNIRVPDGFSPLGSFLRGDELWLGGADGTLAHGPVSGAMPFQRLPSVNLANGIRFVGGSPPSQAFELYLITQTDGESMLYRYDGTQTATLTTHTSIKTPLSSHDHGYGAIAWVAPNEAYAVLPDPNEPSCLVHYKGTAQPELHDFDSRASSALTTLSVAGPNRLAIGSYNGELLTFDGLVWKILPSPLTTRPGPIIRTILPRPHGFIAFSDCDIVEWLDDAGEFCTPQPYTIGMLPEVSQAIDVNGGYIVIGPPYVDAEKDGLVIGVRVN
jgi:hypothetical protein